MDFLTKEEFDDVITLVENKRDVAIFEVLFSTGLRISELLSLERETFERAPLKETLELSIVGKRKKRRTVYVSPHALQVAKSYLQGRTDNDPRLFPVGVRAVQYMMKRYVPTLHPHALRHSMATHLLAGGVDLFSVKEFLGHSRIDMTARYLHHANGRLKEIHSKIYL